MPKHNNQKKKKKRRHTTKCCSHSPSVNSTWLPAKTIQQFAPNPTVSVAFTHQHAFWGGDPERPVLPCLNTETCLKAANGSLGAAGGPGEGGAGVNVFRVRALVFTYAWALSRNASGWMIERGSSISVNRRRCVGFGLGGGPRCHPSITTLNGSESC